MYHNTNFLLHISFYDCSQCCPVAFIYMSIKWFEDCEEVPFNCLLFNRSTATISANKILYN